MWDSDDVVVLSKVISPNPPTVDILFPNGGETFIIGEDITIEWEGNDLDGDTLLYSVTYSLNGEDWVPIDWGLTEGELIWNTSGFAPSNEYKIKVVANDGINTGIDISDGTFTLLNDPPESPAINGTINGKIGVDYEFTLLSMDPNDHKISYFIDWGDGTDYNWFGPYPSGEEVTVNHTWYEIGSYTIKAKAKDTFELLL